MRFKMYHGGHKNQKMRMGFLPTLFFIEIFKKFKENRVIIENKIEQKHSFLYMFLYIMVV